ncbi:MAG: desulfoferrodoxin family protein [Clostridium sp.]
MKQKFFICKHCGNMVGMIHNSGVPMVCCGEKMSELVANTSDGATEKHIPEVSVDGNKVYVNIGSILHPMTEQHNIGWVYVKTNQGSHRKDLVLPCEPKVEIALCEGEIVSEVYAYCNLHGLWKKEL